MWYVLRSCACHLSKVGVLLIRLNVRSRKQHHNSAGHRHWLVFSCITGAVRCITPMLYVFVHVFERLKTLTSSNFVARQATSSTRLEKTKPPKGRVWGHVTHFKFRGQMMSLEWLKLEYGNIC